MSFRLVPWSVAMAALFLSACSEDPAAPDAGQAIDTPSTAEAISEPAEDTTPAVEFASLPEPYNLADFDQGRKTYRLCQSCHTLQEGGPNLVGPNLYGIFGKEIGTTEGFAYSPALQDADFTWTPEELDDWLENPRTCLPGNRMSFAGVRKAEDRAAVIAYIMSQTGYTDAP